MKQKIQNLVWPTEDLIAHEALYYRGEGLLRAQNHETGVYTQAISKISFDTYFNACSIRKWQKYTDMENLSLHLTAQGRFTVRIVGYNLKNASVERKELDSLDYDLKELAEVEITFPKESSQYTLVSFSLSSYTPCRIMEGSYWGEFASAGNEIELAIATTTFRKEEYITKNAGIVYNTLFSGDDEISSHLRMHIVDNGRTLTEADFPKDPRIILHQNKNTGGAGGFARGMIEAMRQTPKATNVLLMDDDVLMQPESIYRTYVLLRHLRPEHTGKFISGAMLFMEDKSVQKEDVGYVDKKGYFVPSKMETYYRNLRPGDEPKYDQKSIKINLINSQDFRIQERSYAAWWYCVIPVQTIEKQGLPMPYFVRGDDMEYGIRCNPGFITMNGICVWHLGFTGKYNVAMDHYQVDRNMLITQYATDLLDGVDVIGKMKNEFRRHLFRFDYDSAELVVRALEDFCKGPSFIMKDRGEQIMQSNGKLNHKMIPLKEMDEKITCQKGEYLGDQNAYYENRRIQPFARVMVRLTHNGQRFWPEIRRKGVITVPYMDEYKPDRIAARTTIVGYDNLNDSGYILKLDKKRYREVMKRWNHVLYYFNAHQKKLREDYTAKRAEMISLPFWKKYLEID